MKHGNKIEISKLLTKKREILQTNAEIDDSIPISITFVQESTECRLIQYFVSLIT